MKRLIDWLADQLIRRIATAREPDLIVGRDNPDGAYLNRWWVIPRNPFFNVYLHQFLRDDDDRALHDHPWVWCSLLLRGGYTEHTIAAGGVHRRRHRYAPSVKFSRPSRAHRVELFKASVFPAPGALLQCWTLFITGPVVRQWGFHCPERGWIPSYEFVDPADSGKVGRGCEP